MKNYIKGGWRKVKKTCSRNNVKKFSMTLSNVKDTKHIEFFLLKVLQKFIMNLRMKRHLVTESGQMEGFGVESSSNDDMLSEMSIYLFI